MSDELRDKWNARHGEAEGPGAAAEVLRENLHLLPTSGTALDLACGLGANALLLAEHGLAVCAWDLSEVAVGRLAATARQCRLAVAAAVRDVVAQPPAPETFDVIVVTHFLDRALCPALVAALRPGGLLVYQTWTRTAVSQGGPSNPDFRLADNELRQLFAPLRLVLYREERDLGDPAQGFRNQAMLIGMKPPVRG